MIHKIAELLRDEIADINFIEIAAGLAKPTPIYSKQDDGVIEKIVPIAYNDLGIVCENDQLYPLVPDTRYMSVNWFEEQSLDMISEDTYYYHSRTVLRLISWFNLPLINTSYTDASLLIANIISTMPEKLTSTDYLSQMRVTFLSEAVDGVLDKYAFAPAENQITTHPYHVSGLDFAVDFAFGKNCVDAVTLSPTSCP